MKNIKQISLIMLVMVLSCSKKRTATEGLIQDLFYVENSGANMAVLVEGNIKSKVVILLVHGGPGGTAIGFQNDEHISSTLEKNYAVAYWEQRAAGISQGNSKLNFQMYVDDLEKVIKVLRHKYGQDIKLFLLSHSWGGLIAPAYLCKENLQDGISGWINVAGAHNYYMNDSLTRNYLLEFGREQIRLGIKKNEWEKIVSFAEANVPDSYNYKLSSQYAACAFEAESLVSDIQNETGGGGPSGLINAKYPFSVLWMLSNAGATYLSDLGNEIIRKEFSSRLHLIKLPLLCITGKYDFTCPIGLAKEVMEKSGSTKKKMRILDHSGHICMENEPETFYKEVTDFVETNR